MDGIIKELLDEMISYGEKKPNDLQHLKKANKEAGGYIEIKTLISEILNWCNLTLQNILKEDLEKLSLVSEEGIDLERNYKRKMKLLIEHSQAFRSLFYIEGDFLFFNRSFSKEDILEIREYVTENDTPKITNIYYKPN